MNTGIERIAAERQRQIDVGGYTAERDDEYIHNELAWAACYYAMPGNLCGDGSTISPDAVFELTEWDYRWAKRDKKTRIQQLIVAGALIAAEIDRLQRVECSPTGTA
jgi:hypothetical protein